MKKLIDIPASLEHDLKKLAEQSNRSVKNWIEDIVTTRIRLESEGFTVKAILKKK